jgi:hypothetical protein
VHGGSGFSPRPPAAENPFGGRSSIVPFSTSLHSRLLDRRSGRRRLGGTWAVPLPIHRRRLRDARRTPMRPSVVRAAAATAAAEGSGMKVTSAKVSSGRNLEAEKQ